MYPLQLQNVVVIVATFPLIPVAQLSITISHDNTQLQTKVAVTVSPTSTSLRRDAKSSAHVDTPHTSTVKLSQVGAVFVGAVLATVVLVKVSLTQPMVRTESTAVPFVPLLVWRTLTVSPFFTVPAPLVHVPDPLSSYSPLVILMAEAVLMPEIVIAAEVITALRATLV